MLEGGVAQGFNATPFGALPFTLVALPNISGKKYKRHFKKFVIHKQLKWVHNFFKDSNVQAHIEIIYNSLNIKKGINLGF